MKNRNKHLAGLLVIRQQLVDSAERELSTRLHEYNRMRDEIEKIDREIAEYSKTLPTKCHGARDTRELIDLRKGLDHLSRFRQGKNQSFSDLISEVEIARKNLLETQKDFEVIEKLQQRTEGERLKRIERREVLELDEMAQARHISNREA